MGQGCVQEVLTPGSRARDKIAARKGRAPMTHQYPRTVAEMIPARKAEVERYPVPECSHGHGPMVLREISEARQTYEQMFCGLWYDCRDARLTYGSYCGSVLYKSRDLAHQLGEPWHDGAQWWQHNSREWVKISDAEADEFWQERAEAQAEQEREQRAAARRKPTVTYDGVTYKVRSRKTAIPDLAAMDRTAALIWLNQNTHARGTNYRRPNPLAGMGGAIKLNVR